jgi:hypothetical protein
MRAVEERVTNLEEVLTEFIIQTGEKINATNATVDRLALEMQDFKDEMSEFKDEMREFKEESERDRKKMGKQWGELSNKMGTMDEDLISPATGPVMSKYFQCEILDRSIRKLRRKNGRSFEVDVLVVSENKVFMIEVRSTPRTEYVQEILNKADEFKYFFPEYSDKEVIPIFASLVFDDNVIKYATKKGLYVMAYREWEYMDIINFDKVKRGV